VLATAQPSLTDAVAQVASPSACSACTCPANSPTCTECFGPTGPCRCTLFGSVTGLGTASCIVSPTNNCVGTGVTARCTYNGQSVDLLLNCPAGGVPLGTAAVGPTPGDLGIAPACSPATGSATAELTATGVLCSLTSYINAAVDVEPMECIYISSA